MCAATALEAQTIPGDNFGSQNSGPFGASVIARYQQVYRADLFGRNPVQIAGLTFFNSVTTLFSEDPRLTRGTYRLFLSTTGAGINALNAGNLNANLGADHRLFATFTVDGVRSSAPNFTIAGSTFTFNPLAGNLLLDVMADFAESRAQGPGAAFLDANVQGIDASSALCTTAGCTSGVQSNTALITRFETPATVVPEPSTYALVAGGLAVLAGVARSRARRRG
jgi:hypothetical protein